MSQPFTQSTDVELIRTAIGAALNETHTSMPAIVESFDAATQTAKVNPSIRRIDRNGRKINIPPVINVPVIYPSGGGFSITFPVAYGDEVLLVFSERAIDKWLQSGGIQDPLDRRKHSYSDAVAIIGIHSNVRAIPSYSTSDLVLRSDSGVTKITVSSLSVDIDIAGTGGATYNADGSVVFKNGAMITATGDFVNAALTTFGTHLHAPTGNPPIVGS